MIYVGTSGWQYRHWKDRFYPKGVAQRAWLGHFASQFPTVEVNNSFYQLPKEATFERWRDETPPGFLFAVKASRYITHIRRLRRRRIRSTCSGPGPPAWDRSSAPSCSS